MDPTQNTYSTTKSDTITLNSGDTLTVPSFTWSGTNSSYLGAPLGGSSSTITSGPYGYPTISVSNNGATTAPWLASNHTGAKIQLDGENADVTVNGWSLVDAVKRIEERLGLFQPNPELEAEWEELRALAEQYRQLEQHIKDKQATWDRIKAMPAPDID
jgi:hypothetical protein